MLLGRHSRKIGFRLPKLGQTEEYKMVTMKSSIAVLMILSAGMFSSLCAQEVVDPNVGPMVHLRITELMFNPVGVAEDELIDNDVFEFIELKNLGEDVLDITNVVFSAGVTFSFRGSAITSLAPGEFVLVVEDQQAFELRYGPDLSGRIAGEYTGRLANGGERITLVDGLLGTIMDFSYGDGRGWPLGTDGVGHSLVALPAALAQASPSVLNYAGNWRRSTNLGGSPGAEDPAPEAVVVINELVANPNAGQTDSVELYNRSEEPISLQGWYLSDDLDDLAQWAIPPQTTLAGLGRKTFYLTGNSSLVSANFRLRAGGEQLALSYLPEGAQGGIRDAVQFKAQESGIALGRYPDGNDGCFGLAPSRDSANTLPMDHLMISEIMYHPADPNHEYIETTNATDQAVVLGSLQVIWRLDGAVEFVFPVDTVMQAGERIVVVGFDPVAAPQVLASFRASYGLDDESIWILGPWSGNLANSSERIALEQALDPAADDNLAWILKDEVIYGDQYPWPTTADAQGDALHRIDLSAELSSMDPANWEAALPTPGTQALTRPGPIR
jgi:hypothetical protein